tara:strand:+ start:234 stop:449 length:216 start_codon:yes stop_codon:yes gene_type:complete
MTVRVWTRRETQSTIKQLRAAGYEIKNVSGMYKIIDPDTNAALVKDGREVFTAMPKNSRHYLISYHPELMQ